MHCSIQAGHSFFALPAEWVDRYIYASIYLHKCRRLGYSQISQILPSAIDSGVGDSLRWLPMQQQCCARVWLATSCLSEPSCTLCAYISPLDRAEGLTYKTVLRLTISHLMLPAVTKYTYQHFARSLTCPHYRLSRLLLFPWRSRRSPIGLLASSASSSEPDPNTSSLQGADALIDPLATRCVPNAS
jgi:hypothetical protein